MCQSSGAVSKSRWTSWAPVPNKPTASVDVKQHFNHQATFYVFGSCFRTLAVIPVSECLSEARQSKLQSPAVRTCEKTQHWPYLTGLPDDSYCRRMDVLDVHFVGLVPPE